MIISGVYKIQSISHPDRCYIGSAINIKKRWGVHMCGLTNNKHHSRKLQRHFNKYGKDDLVFSVVESCLPAILINKEQYYIDILHPYFNVSKIAGSRLGLKHSKESKIKIGSSKKGKKHSEEHRLKIKQALIGHIVSLKARHKLSESLRGNKNGANNKGKIHGPQKLDVRKKHSVSMIGKNTWMKGRKFSSEVRLNMSKAHIKKSA